MAMSRGGQDLLTQIERDALDEGVPLAATLRKCIALGAQARNADLRDWASQELDGYRDGGIPEYRTRSARRTYRISPRMSSARNSGWATSLREVSAGDIRAILPPSGNPRSILGGGLRSVFTVLKEQKMIFANPIARIKTGYHEPREPLPVNLALVRDALDSPDAARAAIIALAAFHALRAGQLQTLLLTDVRDGRLHLSDRTIPLAAPARVRVAAWLDYRARRWPHTANPHLFITMRSALGLNTVGDRWLFLKTGIPGGVQALREDRILHEAHASGGDIRLLCDLFGLSVTAASRYTATIDHPDLISKARSGNAGTTGK